MTSGKKAEAKAATLKGQEAEDAVLQYLKRMNRPFGAVDVSSNLKGAVPKTATQKILLTLAEKGEITQKTYGKSTFFVYNQSKIENLPAEKLVTLEAQLKDIEEENKLLTAEVKSLSAELGKIKSTPTDSELDEQVVQTEEKIATTLTYLEPLRAGSSIISASELAQLDEDWKRWRQEWVKRRKVFNMLRDTTLEATGPKEAAELLEDIGVELDSPEHAQLERSYLCSRASRSRS
ncbi:TBPIP-domain-containing protein [Thelephora ganbajun]|uniref:TBPIP-domain-containing protein n=1 Tax=Thelephora ganbajun TaxID=370292 RepID=A0ACB6ZE68_THEGA|nr:TBPIP-domain-containing protein [Thelephora ganbajun]